MFAVKGHYRHGRDELGTPIPGLDDAEVMVVVAMESTSGHASAPERGTINSHTEDDWKMDVFGAAGLATFFEGADDENVDWREIFDVKGR